MTRTVMTKVKAAAIAAAYVASGFSSKSKAMIKAGMDEKYAKSGKGYKMFRNKMVTEAIQALVDKSTTAAEITLDDIVAGFIKKAFPKEGDESVSDANQLYALDRLAKIKGGYIDRLEIGRMDELKEVSKAEEARYRVMANFMTHLQLDVNHVVSNALAGKAPCGEQKYLECYEAEYQERLKGGATPLPEPPNWTQKQLPDVPATSRGHIKDGVPQDANERCDSLAASCLPE